MVDGQETLVQGGGGRDEVFENELVSSILRTICFLFLTFVVDIVVLF